MEGAPYWLELFDLKYSTYRKAPAQKAGVQKGDRILEINGKKGFETNINEIRSLFEVSSNKPMRLVLVRGEKTLTVEIEMKSEI